MTARCIKTGLVSAGFLLLSTGFAQAEAIPEQIQQFDAMYEQLIAQPDDVDNTIAYAELAVAMKDYEAAIPPLERLLMIQPNSHKLKLELGILYFLLESKDVAKTYLDDAATAQDADIAAQANQYLAKL